MREMLPTPKIRRDRAASFCLALLVMPSGALAADYFVDPNGNDQAGGTTESKAFKTMRRAVEAATLPGDTVWIRGGVYLADSTWSNQLSFRYSGTAEAPITFRNYPGELPILDGSALYADGASGVEPVAPTTAPVAFVRVIGLVARNWGTSGFSNSPTLPNRGFSCRLSARHSVGSTLPRISFSGNTARRWRFRRFWRWSSSRCIQS